MSRDGLQSPVFILGLHRSGTTLLYQMLAASGRFNFVTARHVICFDRLRDGTRDGVLSRSCLRARFARLGLSSRGVDVVGLDPDTPEEYSFILDNLNAGMSISRRHFRVFRMIYEVIQRDCGQERTLLLKNPWDFGNAALIKSLMPDARFVYIHRNPFHTLSSLFRVVVAAATRRHEYLSLLSNRYRALSHSEFPWRIVKRATVAKPALLAQWLIHHSARFASRYCDSIRTDRTDDRFDVRYETLCRRPDDTMADILAYLGVTGAKAEYGKMIDVHTSGVVPEIASQRDLVVEKLGDYAAAVGYDLPDLAAGLRQ